MGNPIKFYAYLDGMKIVDLDNIESHWQPAGLLVYFWLSNVCSKNRK